MKAKAKLLFKVLVDGRSCQGGTLEWSTPKKTARGWTAGAWHSIAELPRLCERGFHLTDDPAAWWKDGCVVYVAEGRGQCDTSTERPHKAAYQEARILRPATTGELEACQIFDSGAHVIKADYAVACGSSHVVARGSSRVEAWESSRVVAWESSRVVARGSSRVVAWESSHVVARGSSRVEAWESSRVEAWESSHVVARGSSHVVACGSSRVVACESSRVEAWESSHVVACGSSTTNSYGASVTTSENAVSIDRTTRPPMVVVGKQ